MKDRNQTRAWPEHEGAANLIRAAADFIADDSFRAEARALCVAALSGGARTENAYRETIREVLGWDDIEIGEAVEEVFDAADARAAAAQQQRRAEFKAKLTGRVS